MYKDYFKRHRCYEWRFTRDLCLAPILTVLFINDLPGKLISDCMLYVDDSKIIAPIKNDIDAIND